MKILFFLLFPLLCACSSGNSVVIANQADESSLQLTNNRLYIDPSLLGMPQGTNITVHTSQDSEMSFNVDLPTVKQSNSDYEGKAF